MPKVRLIKEGIIQYDNNTGHAWVKFGEVIETPLTPFIYERLGKTLEIVFDPEPLPQEETQPTIVRGKKRGK